MFKITKKYYLLFLFLISNNYNISSFFDNNPFQTARQILDFGEQLLNEPQLTSSQHNPPPPPKPQPQQAYNHTQTLNTYLSQLRKDLNGLPNNEIDEIIDKTKKALHGINLSNDNYVEEVKRGILIEHADHKIGLLISRYETQNDIKFNQDIRHRIQENRQKAFIDHIQKLPHITGNDIKAFFGNYREVAVEQICTVFSQKQRNASTPSAPSAPTPPAPQRPHYSPEYKDDYLSKQDIKYLEQKLSNSSHDQILKNAKRELELLLNKKLDHEENELKEAGDYYSHEIYNAIEAVRTQKADAIKKLKKADNASMAKIIGNSPNGSNNIKTAVHEFLRKNRR